jgi:uncharacterized protein YukE
MQTFPKPVAALLVLAIGLLGSVVAQDAAAQIAEIGSSTIANAAATSALATSVHDAIAPFSSSLGGQAQQAVQQVVDLANANAQANNRLNEALQRLLDSASTFAETDDNAAGIFNGFRKLRTQNDK